ncbi:hypothetical protein [Pseudotabrizicola alkalilacus]|uniref:hypothetical protein n=1 Tax=Pseudotabrizicola alkalilacus TaxID=2305252 RepID=UPI0011C1AAAC|nr:hypothetical protein [Pseudotabrizicola alkalilacus]
MSRLDPLSMPEWRAIALECKLTRQLCGTGLTALGRANYADGMGEYYTAFFSLSIGLERLGKLIFCFIEQQKSGAFPSDSQLRTFGHNLKNIINYAEGVANERGLADSFKPLDQPICSKIVDHLTAFSAAGTGRYANFLVMSGGTGNKGFEPVGKWWELVGTPILEKHFRGTKREVEAKLRAQHIDAFIGDFTLVRHTAESGDQLGTVEAASFRTAETEVVQKYGRFHVFTLIRRLASIFDQLTSRRGYEAGGELWFGHYEHFNTFTVDDEFGLRRRIWPLR